MAISEPAPHPAQEQIRRTDPGSRAPGTSPEDAGAGTAPAPAGTGAPPRPVPSGTASQADAAARAVALRAPLRPAVRVPAPLPPAPLTAELTGPVFGTADVGPLDHDLTRQHRGEPVGERIVVSGRVTDRRGRPVRGQLVELWQANAAGRYAHPLDRHPAPLDPHFTGAGRCLTGDDGRYRFVTVRPGAYPLGGPRDLWRASHLHFSLFGTAFTQRLVTQMYFPGDPLLADDVIRHTAGDAAARARLTASLDRTLGEPGRSLGYRWDIVLDGPSATWTEGAR